MPERGVPTSVLVKCHGYPPARPHRHHDLRRVPARCPRAERADHSADRERNADTVASPRRAGTRQPRCGARRSVSASRRSAPTPTPSVSIAPSPSRSSSTPWNRQTRNQKRQSRPRPPTTACGYRGRRWAQSASSPPQRCSRSPCAEATDRRRPATPASVTPAQTTPPVTQAASPNRAGLCAARRACGCADCDRRARRGGDRQRAGRGRRVDDHERPTGRPRHAGWHRPRCHATHRRQPHYRRHPCPGDQGRLRQSGARRADWRQAGDVARDAGRAVH